MNTPRPAASIRYSGQCGNRPGLAPSWSLVVMPVASVIIVGAWTLLAASPMRGRALTEGDRPSTVTRAAQTDRAHRRQACVVPHRPRVLGPLGRHRAD